MTDELIQRQWFHVSQQVRASQRDIRYRPPTNGYMKLGVFRSRRDEVRHPFNWWLRNIWSCNDRAARNRRRQTECVDEAFTFQYIVNIILSCVMSGRADTVYRIDPMTPETPLRNKCECCIIPTVRWKGVVSVDELSNCCVEEQS